MKVNVSQWRGKRESQEDSYMVKYFPDGVLLLVCDGMGGHSHGELASQTAAKVFADTFAEDADGMSMSDRLLHALVAANKAVGAAMRSKSAYGGTTLLAAYVSGGVLWWISVGDSPLLLWRNGNLMRLNEDHSLRSFYMQLVKSGQMTYERAASFGHSLRSALTGDMMSLVDATTAPYPLLPGDRLLLASDGADDVLQPCVLTGQVRELLNARSGASLAVRVVQACIEQDAPHADNVTVLSMDWPE